MVGFSGRKTGRKYNCLAIKNEIFKKISINNFFELCSDNFIINQTHLRTIVNLAV